MLLMLGSKPFTEGRPKLAAWWSQVQKRPAVEKVLAEQQQALIHLGMGDRERALDELEKAYATHSQMVVLLGMERIFDPIRSEPPS
jgi:hypothetical protein